MSTSVQTIANRAKAFSTANTASAIGDSSEIIARVASIERRLFAEAAQLNRAFFLTSGSFTSTTGSSGRVVDLSAADPPIMRVVKVTLPDTRIARQVDILDTDGELAPRYYALGQTLVEVGNDWNTASSAAQTLTVHYVQGPSALDADGSMTQTVSVPDEWADCLVLPLAIYLHQKDVGRDPGETERLMAEAETVRAAFFDYVRGYAGVGAMRFDIPLPSREREGQS